MENQKISLSADEMALETIGALLSIQANTEAILRTQAQILAKLNDTKASDELEKIHQESDRVRKVLSEQLFNAYQAKPTSGSTITSIPSQPPMEL